MTKHDLTGVLSAAVIGALAFLLLTGGSILIPTNTQWLMGGDPASHWMGWQFFRYTPWLQWPIGANPNYGMEIGSSVVFSDSVPIMAFLLKPFSSILPAQFQYLGFWIFLSFVLQAVFAYKIFRIFDVARLPALLGATFLAIAPVFLMRATGHFALSGHWMILAGFYLYFSPEHPGKSTRWVILLGAATLVHAYLFVMVGMIWAASVISRVVSKEMTVIRAGIHSVAAVVTVVILAWASGYFILQDSWGNGAISQYRTHLLTFTDANFGWSYLFTDVPQPGTDFESFNYLGAGVLLAVIVGLTLLLVSRRRPFNVISYAVIGLVCFAAFLFSLSNVVAIGSHDIISFDLPGKIEILAGNFRAVSRFAWLLYYLVFLTGLVLCVTLLTSKWSVPVLAFCLVVQIADSWAGYASLRRNFEPRAWESSLKSPLWQTLGGRYKSVRLVLPEQNSEDWLQFAEYADRNKMAVNSGSFARVSPTNLSRAEFDIAQDVINAKLANDAVYIFKNDHLWDIALRNKGASDAAMVLDGYKVLAPAFGECVSACDKRSKSPYLYDYRTLKFAEGSEDGKFLVSGWYPLEQWGAWSKERSIIEFEIPASNRPTNYRLLMTGNVQPSAPNLPMAVAVRVNGIVVGTLEGETLYSGRWELPVFDSALGADARSVRVEFEALNPVKPSDNGNSLDTRLLSFGLSSLALLPVR